MSEKKGKKKTGLIIGGIIAAVVLILLVCFIMAIGSKTRVAFINVEAGDVQIDTGSGWKLATNGADLGLNDKVKTGADGKASVVLYESAVVSLDPNTEISIAELSKENSAVEQQTGTTWNKFTGLSGLKGLEVETPTAVATVRGTEYMVLVDKILVAEGTVEVTDKEGNTVQVTAGNAAELIDGKYVVRPLTEDEKALLREMMKRHIDVLKSLRQDEMDKHPVMVSTIKSMYKLTDEDIQNKIEKIDNGELNEDELAENAPFDVASIEKFVALTKQIKAQMTLMSQYS